MAGPRLGADRSFAATDDRATGERTAHDLNSSVERVDCHLSFGAVGGRDGDPASQQCRAPHRAWARKSSRRRPRPLPRLRRAAISLTGLDRTAGFPPEEPGKSYSGHGRRRDQQQGNAEARFFHRETLVIMHLLGALKVQQAAKASSANSFGFIVRLRSGLARKDATMLSCPIFSSTVRVHQCIDASHALLCRVLRRDGFDALSIRSRNRHPWDV